MTSELNPGTVLKAQYRVIEMVGGGGMGRVYRAEDLRRPGQTWALKELQLAPGTSEEQVQAQQQFRHEAELLATLSHPNLPRVTDYFDTATGSYLVMEFIEGHTLQHFLDAAPDGLPEAQVVPWLVQVCEVLSYLHGLRPPIIFRDLKPTNIMLASPERIVLIDFGIARTYKVGKRHDTSFMGSANYAPKEQWGRGQTDARSDVYALGATAYHLLTGTAPPISTLPSPPPAPRTLNPAISPALEGVVSTAMGKEPEERFQTAQAMMDALAACLGSGRPPAPQAVAAPAASPQQCPACGWANRPGANFCGACGASLSGTVKGWLQLHEAGGAFWEMPLAQSPFVIGRLSADDGIFPSLDLSPYDTQFVSRRHAQIVRCGSDFAIEDLNSANGTLVNGVRLAPHAAQVLHPGDRLRIGSVDLVFRLAGC